MKNLSFTLLLMFLCGSAAWGQTTFSTSDTIVASVEMPEITAAGADTVFNLTSTAINIGWLRTIVSISPGCVIQVCDPNNCYLPTVNSKIFVIQPNKFGNMMVDLVDTTVVDTTVIQQPASAIVRLRYVNTSIPTDTASTYFFLSIVGATNGVHNPSSAVQVVLYPNPVTESFTLDHAENVRLVRLYNMNGQQVAEYAANTDQRYLLANQPVGTYFVALADENGRVIQALQIVKR